MYCILYHLLVCQQEMDRDANGTITFDEFIKFVFPFAKPHEVDAMVEWTIKVREVATATYMLIL
jgi:hypothetical protein